MCSKPRDKLSRLVHHKRNLINGMCEMSADEAPLDLRVRAQS